MYWLIFACVLEFGFAQLFKHAQRRGLYAPAVVSTNYLALAAALGLYLLLSRQLSFSAEILKVGTITGIGFICSMSIMTKALQLAHVAAVLTAFRMSVIVPVVVGIWLWHEEIGPTQVAGIAVALLGLFMMTRGTHETHRTNKTMALGLVVLVFCAQGASQSCMRWVHHADLDDDLLKVMFVVGLTAGTLGAAFVSLQRHRPVREELLTGVGIGWYNLLVLFVILTALGRFDGAVFFPTIGSTVVILDSLFAHLFWKERLSRLSRWGAVLAVLSIFLVLS